MVKRIVRHFSGSDLKARCARSGFVLTLGTAADRGLAFLSKMILVRLLLPEEMGLMVLVISLSAMFEVFTEVGIKQSVIQHKDGASDGYLNMAWWFQTLRAVGLYLVAFAIAPMVCDFYFANKADVLAFHTMDDLVKLVRAAFLVILFNGLISPGVHVLEKRFRFGKSMMIIQGSAIIGTIITIILAFILRNVWAMVIGFCCMSFLKCGFSYIFCAFRPKFSFDRESFSELMRYARGVFGSPILAYFAFHLDVLVAGRIVGADLLGMYGMAVLLARIPQELFSYIINPVLLPVFAEQQSNKDMLAGSVLRITKVTALFAVPLTAVSVMCSREIISLAFGVNYVKIAPVFAILCIYVVLLVEAKILSNLFFGIGQPDKHRTFVSVRVTIISLLIYPAIRFFGMTGVAFVLVFANFCALAVQVTLLDRVLGIKISDYTNCWSGGVKVGLAVMCVMVIMRVIQPSMSLINLFVGMLCMFVSLGLLWIYRGNRLVKEEEAIEQVPPYSSKFTEDDEYTNWPGGGK